MHEVFAELDRQALQELVSPPEARGHCSRTLWVSIAWFLEIRLGVKHWQAPETFLKAPSERPHRRFLLQQTLLNFPQTEQDVWIESLPAGRCRLRAKKPDGLLQRQLLPERVSMSVSWLRNNV